MRIENAADGGSFGAKVNSHHRLETESTSVAAQAKASLEDGSAYQVHGEITIGTTDVPVLHIMNTSQSDAMVITYIRAMSIGAAVSNVNAYFTIRLDDDYVSGGGVVTPTNLNRTKGFSAPSTAHDGTGSLSVSGGVEIDKDYTANDMIKYNKEGSIVLGPGNSISVFHKGSTVAGTAWARLSFYYSHIPIG